MTVDAATSPTWRCCTCGLVTYFMLDAAVPSDLPAGWNRDDDGDLRCLLCRRRAAGEEALREAGLTLFDRGASTVRARALVAFELQRAPDVTGAGLAKAAGVSAVTAGKMRRDLEAEMVGRA